MNIKYMNFKLATYATMKRKLRDILGLRLIPVGCIALQLSFLGFILTTTIQTAYSQSTSVLTGSLSGASGNESISNYDSISSDSVSTTDLAATGTITADTISATSAIRAATFVFSASEIQLYIGDTTTSDSGKALIYDATSNAINLLPITDYLDFATVGSSLNFGDISDVSVEFASEGWVPAWNAVSEIWEATPAVTTSGSTGITESEVNTLIEAATTSLTFDEISNVSMTAKVDGVIPYWNAAESVWDATPQASGGTSTGGASALSELTDVSLSSPTNGQFLGYNGSAWINTTGGSGGASTATIVIAAANSLDTSGAHYICDGVSDEIEINAALGDLGTVGGSIYLKEGTYNIAGVINIATAYSVHIFGAGYATVLKRMFNAGGSNVQSYGVIRGNSTNLRLAVSNLQIDGNNGSYSSAYNAGISIDTLMFFLCYNVYFLNCAEGVYVDHPSGSSSISPSVIVDSCVFNTCTRGAWVYACNVIVSNNRMWKCGNGLYASGHMNKALVKGNSVVDGTGSYAVAVNSNVDSDFVVVNNYIRGQSGYGINVLNSHTGTISNNSIESTSNHGIYLGTAFDFVKVSGNTIVNAGGSGIRTFIGTVDLEITDNIISDCVSAGVYIHTNPGNCLISNNIIKNGDNNGIYTNCVNVWIKDNVIYGNASNGIVMYGYGSGENNKISGNSIFNNSGDGIGIEGGQTNHRVDITDNSIKGNGVYAIDMYLAAYNTTASISNNRISGNASYALFRFAGNFYAAIKNNIYSSPYSSLLSVSSANRNRYIFDDNMNADPALSGTRILAASSGACIGFATDELTSIDHVITVAPDATTNPIATSWDTWSLPELKSGIASVSDDKKRSSVGNIGALKLIEYDWKYNEPEPEIAKEDIGTATETAIRQGWEKRKAGWERQKNKVKSWSADITDPAFPAELGSYNADGKLTGINNTAVIWRLVGAVQELQAEVERLKFGGKN